MAKKKRPDPSTLPLFGDEHPQPPHPARGTAAPAPAASVSEYAAKNGARLRRWASRGIFFGTSSWKYPGWKGMVYQRSYPSKRDFDRECLSEYATVFPTVCADFALYDFPNPEAMAAIYDQTTDGFRLALKVTDRITVRRYPDLKRYGPNAGTRNPDFLNRELFEDAFLRPLDALKEKRGAIIFEFSTFYPSAGLTYGSFVALLDAFLAKLPPGYEYAVELRNQEFLTPEYLAMLASHGVAHVLNSWTRMPPIIEQIHIAGVLTAGFSVARALLRPGRTYEDAVNLFQPYDAIKEEYPELRLGLAESVNRCIAEGRTLYAYVNNRAEGNSPKTIEGILDILDRYPVEKL